MDRGGPCIPPSGPPEIAGLAPLVWRSLPTYVLRSPDQPPWSGDAYALTVLKSLNQPPGLETGILPVVLSSLHQAP